MSTITVGGSTTANEQGLFQCGSCKRTYNRLDHLARHVRSHTNFKPHRCPVCDKSFARTDLLKRHVAAHDVRSAKVNNPPRGAVDDGGRVTQACRACATNHVRCSEWKPCRRCTEKGLECIYAQSDDPLTPASPASHPSQVQSSLPPMSPRLDRAEPMHLEVVEVQDAVSTHTNPSQPHSGSTATITGSRDVQQLFGFDDDVMDTQVEFPTGLSTPRFADWNFLPGQWPAPGSMTVEQGFPNIELDDLDLRFLDIYKITVPFELGNGAQSETSQHPPPMGISDQSHPASRASEAFQTHHWRFRPNPRDNRAAEEHNLSLPSDARDGPSPDSPHVSFTRRVTPTRLSSAARDNILTIVIQSCRPENVPKAVASFPSVELLDTLIQFYLTSPIVRADSFIHAASFDPNEKKPELLLAMAAAGAVLTSDPALTKLGYAMQESARTAVVSLWEHDNSLVRNLELTQAFLIHLETNLWSGHGRKVEITESFLQSPLTMVRRAGRFRNSCYPAVVMDAGLQNTSLETAWRTWIEQESFKRTAFRLVRHDMDSSMYLMVNPLVSYGELSLPLPCAPSLWGASSADQWKDLLLSQGGFLQQQPPTVADYFDDPGACKPQYANFDVAIANDAFLACAWSLSWECIQLGSLQRTKPRRWNAFLLSSRQEEILKLLEYFRLSLDAHHTPHFGEVQIRLELILLHLHAPFDDIQVFAGIEGPEQARAVYPAVLEWAGTEAARKAICHAGQVLRFARCNPSNSLQELLAILIYQASLVLWVFALLMSRGKNESSANTSDQQPDAVWLDGEDDIALQRFKHFGVGMPHFRGSAPSGGTLPEVALSDPEAVLGVIIGILRDNYVGLPKPHLVERLLQLMGALQRSSIGMMEFPRPQ